MVTRDVATQTDDPGGETGDVDTPTDDLATILRDAGAQTDDGAPSRGVACGNAGSGTRLAPVFTFTMLILLFLAACFLAYSNGANDNFKGVASLYGSRTADLPHGARAGRRITTFAGSITSIFLAQSLLKKFSGKGLVPDSLVGSEHFLLAVVIGAALTVILATLTGFPVSTTHGLTGALVGAGLLAVGGR